MLTRPEQVGLDHAVASTHWMATGAGADVLSRGGNAADAAAATAFVLQVVEPHLNGPGGEVPIIVRTPDGAVAVIDGQGVAPSLATIEHYRAEGLDVIPGTGMLAATVPSAFAAWTLLVERHGTWELADVLAPAISIAERGYPMLPAASRTIGAMRDFFAEHWPTSADAWLTASGSAPAAGERWRNPALVATWRRVIDEARGPTREARLAAGRDAFLRGFVAEEIGRFVTDTEVMDASGSRHRGLLTADDLGSWSPGVEPSEQVDYAGWTVHTTSFWGQGPVLLQQLRLLDALDLASLEYASADYWHTIIEASKLAFADREAWYGDPRLVDVPGSTLLARTYAAERARLVDMTASLDLRPGSPDGRPPRLPPTTNAAPRLDAGTGEPTVARDPVTPTPSGRGDTCHLDVTDAAGLTISATPSGGWLQSSPMIPSLGFCLGSRAQMFWLTEGLPSSLAPGRRPRTTLAPNLAVHDDGTVLSFGTPGGDQQAQWSLAFFLAHLHGSAAEGGRLGLQAAIEEPVLHHLHAPESFAPRGARPGVVVAEPRIGDAVLADLRARGHRVELTGDWTLGRTSAVASGAPDGFVRAASNPRGEQGYAIAR